MFENDVVLITGGTGSFGRTMTKHLLDRNCPQVRIFSRDEAKQDDMRREFSSSPVQFHLGDVRDVRSVAEAMKDVTLVFHAAALKQVPSCEFFPMQAVMTNVVGSSNVIDEAVRHRVRSVVCLSTDKAVYPVNAMGMTKALMEKVAQAAARTLHDTETVVSSVRYGNVMYSRGSVIPLFVSQLLGGGPLTVTEPEMTRFMLPLRQAVDLVEFAFLNARQGDLFIRKAPACTIRDLAAALQNLFGTHVKMNIIGMRHGEKLYETLANKEELRHSQDLGEYYRVTMDGRDLNYDKYFIEGDTEEASTDDFHSSNAVRLNVGEVEALLLSLPEIVRDLQVHRTSLPSAVNR